MKSPATPQLVDGLPAAEMKGYEKTGEVFYDIGFNLGNDEDIQFQELPAMHNHYDILIKYQSFLQPAAEPI
jgi:transmembrane 9 superfamily protein 2/4